MTRRFLLQFRFFDVCTFRMKSFLFICLCFIAVAHGGIIPGEDYEWNAFKEEYKKEYKAEDEPHRKKIFESNLKV